MASPVASASRSWLDLPSGWSRGGRILLLALAYYALARVGLEFTTLTSNISPVWPPSGLALGALILGGLRLWPGVALGAIGAALSAGAAPPVALVMALGNTLEPLVTVAFLRVLFGFRENFEQPRQVLGFILLHGLLGAPISALLGTGALWMAGGVPSEHLFEGWLTWWGGNFTGGLVLGPLLIAVNQMGPRMRPAARWRELALSAALLVAVGGTVFLWGMPWGLSHPALLVLPLPLVVWIAWRFGIGGAALSLLLLSAMAVSGAANDTGPFAAESPRVACGFLLLYIVVVAMTALVLAAFNVQREQVVERLRQREWQIAEAQRIGNFGVWAWELGNGRFTLSEVGMRILGEAAERFHPRIETLFDRVHTDDRQELMARLDSVRNRSQPETCELRVVAPDGHLRHVTLTCAALRDRRGQVERLLGTVFDFSDRQRQEDEQVQMQRRLLENQKLESLGLLAGGIAHDFNNLLTGVLGNASLLRSQLPDDAPMHTGLRRIEASAERAADLCRQMLAYSGKGRFAVRLHDLNEVVGSTLVLAQNSMPGKAELSFLPDSAALRVKADMLQLRQVLLNLLVNAAEALPESGGRVAVRTGTMGVDRTWLAGAYLAPELPEGEYAFLEVEDTGEGIAPELVAKVFDPFFSTKFIGRGLGLAAVAGIVRAHHGAVRLASRVGQGSTFRIVFPIAQEEPEADAPHPEPVPSAASAAGVVLVVDDERTVRQVTADLLDGTGIATQVAVDGVHALELFGATGAGVRAVLLDYSMPRLDGLETFKRLRERRADLPIVLMSGFPAEHALDRFKGLGLAGFVQKPFTRAVLLAALARAGVR